MGSMNWVTVRGYFGYIDLLNSLMCNKTVSTNDNQQVIDPVNPTFHLSPDIYIDNESTSFYFGRPHFYYHSNNTTPHLNIQTDQHFNCYYGERVNKDKTHLTTPVLNNTSNLS